MAASPPAEDRKLAELGIEPRLKRSLNLAASAFFAVGFQGPTAGAFLIGPTAVLLLGPAFIWVIPLLFLGQIMASLIWAELVAHFPVEGGVYQWARFIGGDRIGALAGLFYLIALIIITTSLGVAFTIFLNGLFPGFSVTTAHTVLVTTGLVAGCVTVSLATVRLVALINSLGVIFELIVLVGVSIAFFVNAHQPVTAFGHTKGALGGHSFLHGYLIVVALMAGALLGSETAGIFAEEAEDSERSSGRAILLACTAVCLVMGLFFASAILSTGNFTNAIAHPVEWITGSLDQAVGRVGSKVFFVAAMVAAVSTTLACLSSAGRVMYGMARDGELPASRTLARLWTRSGQPGYALMIAAVGALVPLIYASKIAVILAAETAMLIVPYVLTTGALVVRRLRGWPERPSRFELGRWGLPLTVVSLVWFTFLLIDCAWSRPETNPHLGPLPVVWEVVAVLIIAAGAWWLWTGTRRTDAIEHSEAASSSRSAAVR
jgi:amino acid transporter